MERTVNPSPAVDHTEPSTPSQTKLSDKNLYKALAACGVGTLALTPLTLSVFPGIGVGTKLWIAFLGACLVVWTAVVLIATVKTASEALSRTAEPEATPQPVEHAELPDPRLAQAA